MEILPQIEALVAESDIDSAYAMALEPEKYLPDDPLLERLWSDIAVRMSFVSEPSGAEVFYKRYSDVDNDWESPRIVGTGLEDYFLGGWYFREGPFQGPLHGVPVKDTLNASVAMYRVHESDAVHFCERFRMDFVNPWDAERLQPFAYASTAYLYTDRPERSAPPLPDRDALLCWYRVRNCDHQSIP